MTRYKGRQSARAVEQDFPHHVDMLVPPGGLGRRLNEMYDWHVLYGIKARHGKGSHDANGAVIRWCFASRKIAESFAAQCCGVRE
jgi:hypothetical protein